MSGLAEGQGSTARPTAAGGEEVAEFVDKDRAAEEDGDKENGPDVDAEGGEEIHGEIYDLRVVIYDFQSREAAGFRVGGEDSGEVGGFGIFERGESVFNDARNRKKGDATGEEGGDGRSEGGAPPARRGNSHRHPRCAGCRGRGGWA